jgi:hypothetical protein
MVKVLIEVRSGAARFDVAVQAESIQRAVSFARGRYPKASVKVGFPIEPESFFVEDPPTARRGIVGLEPPARVAA